MTEQRGSEAATSVRPTAKRPAEQTDSQPAGSEQALRQLSAPILAAGCLAGRHWPAAMRLSSYSRRASANLTRGQQGEGGNGNSQ